MNNPKLQVYFSLYACLNPELAMLFGTKIGWSEKGRKRAYQKMANMQLVSVITKTFPTEQEAKSKEDEINHSLDNIAKSGGSKEDHCLNIKTQWSKMYRIVSDNLTGPVDYQPDAFNWSWKSESTVFKNQPFPDSRKLKKLIASRVNS